MFFEAHFEEEELDDLDDALIGELDDELEDDPALEEVFDPLLKGGVLDELDEDPEGGDSSEDGAKVFDDEEEEEDMDYDSFDDEDDL